MTSDTSSGSRGIILLLDPDRVSPVGATTTVALAAASGFSEAWVGGTFLHGAGGASTVDAIIDAGTANRLPIFAILGLSSADALLRPGLSGVILPLIGTVAAAGELVYQAYRATPALNALAVKVIPIAYLAIDGGRITSSSHGLQGVPLPRDKPEIAATLARCGEFMGAHAVYLDSGSGAQNTVPSDLIDAVRRVVTVRLIVGGGIRQAEQADIAFAAGADSVVVGSAFESAASSALFQSFGDVTERRGNQ